MRKLSDCRLAIGGLIAFSFWLFVFLPLYYDRNGDDSAARNCSAKEKENYGFWEQTRCDPVAYFTAWLVGFTGVLALSTIGLWYVTYRVGKRQEADTRILQRAYISVEPDGLHPSTRGPPACVPTIEIGNVGNLPARNVRWTIHSTLDFDDRRPRDKLAITWPLEGEITLSPKIRMKQGALEPRVIRHDTESLRPQFGLYVYVWGVVRYDDGFGDDQATYFCHRYNCVNLRNVNADLSAPGAFRYDAQSMIAREYGRYHRYGNDAT